MPYRTLYDILGVRPNVTFEDLKKAYYQRAKSCHPDLNPNKPDATEEFQRLVNAFDILSDPSSRKLYDQQRTALDEHLPDSNSFHDSHAQVMDTIADDILEELVVGNNISLRHTTLQNLMLDLVKTTHFIMFREAKQAYEDRHFKICYRFCRKLVDLSPQNILYHYYLAEAARHLGKDLQALMHYRRCLHIGVLRNPPQRLDRVRRHYQRLLKRQGWIGRTIAYLAGEPLAPELSEKDRTQREMDRFFTKALKKKHNRPQALNSHPKPRQLTEKK